MIKKSLVLILIIATMLPSLLAESDALEAGRGRPEPPPEPPRVLPEPPPFAANQVLVSFQPGVTSPEIATFYAEHNLIEMKSVGRGPKDDSRLRLAQVRPPAEMGDSEGFLQKLHRDSKVDFAELNYILTSYEGPNDPDFNELWGLHNTGQGTGTADADIDAFEAWHDFTTGSSSVIVGIIDSGVDYNHPDLAANMWVNPGEIPGNGLDDDGNGYIDDVHGINTITGSGDPMDDLGHGTHVAGTIGAVGNNGIGVVGVSWDVRIVACKFLGAGGSGFTSDAVECFKYFNQLKADGHNVLLTNNSWGGGGFSDALRDAMEGVDQEGMVPILHAAAAGNSNWDNDSGFGAHFPSSYSLDNIIAVAATDRNDNYAGFSSYGKTTVDLAAPGVAIRSTVPPQPSKQNECGLCDPSGYLSLSGTSMATPHVAGAAALVWAQFPGLSASQVKQLLLWRGDYIGALGGNSSKPTLTNRRLNVFNSLENEVTPPAAVTGLAASAYGLYALTLTWTATGDDGSNGAASSYDVRYSTSAINNGNWNAATQATGEPSPQLAGSPESFTVPGLDYDTTYHVAVKAIDNVGNVSPMSNVSGSTDPAPTELLDTMENGPGEWAATGLWNLSNRKSNSPTHAWYYGQPSSGDYDTGVSNSGTLKSIPVDLTGATDPALNFSYWRQVESYASGAFDQTYVDVSYDGSLWTRVWQKDSTDPSGATWKQASIPLDSKMVYVRFGFDTMDGAYNESEGWYIDDLAIVGSSSVEPPPDTTPPAAPSGLAATPGDGKVDLDWDANLASDLAGYNVHRGSSAGGPYAQVNLALVVGQGLFIFSK